MDDLNDYFSPTSYLFNDPMQSNCALHARVANKRPPAPTCQPPDRIISPYGVLEYKLAWNDHDANKRLVTPTPSPGCTCSNLLHAEIGSKAVTAPRCITDRATLSEWPIFEAILSS